MAGETHEIAVGESDSLWALVAEIAGSLPPDSLGAIIAKAAAHKIDRRDRERHLTDVISLLASAPRGTFAGREYSAKDRQYLRHVISELEDLQQPRWLVLDSRERAQATASFEDLILVVT